MEEKLEFLQEIVDLKNKEIVIKKRNTTCLSKLHQIEYEYHSPYGEINRLETYHISFEEGNEPMFLLDNFSYHISNNTGFHNLKTKLVIKEGLILKSYFFYLITYIEKFKKTKTKPSFTPDLRVYETLTYGLGSEIIYNIAVPDEYDKIIKPLTFGENIKIDKKLTSEEKDLLGIKLIWHPFKETLFDPEEEEKEKYKYPENVF